MAFVKKLVSKKKRRFYEDGFDLDLSYIKPNIVAMGFPSERIEGVYRNHIDEILRFLETKHKDHYKVYNLCSEKEYDTAKFNHRVTRYPFDDHNAPPFQLIQPYCEDMDEFLTAHEKNVAIVHCKAGKGRTGVMICAYLLHKKYFETCKQALEYYGDARTSNKKGVTIPSQRRYVYYYGHYLKHNLLYTPTTLLLTRFVMETVPSFYNGTCTPFFYVWQSKVKIYSSKSQESPTKDAKNICFNLPQPLPVCGDIKVQFFNKAGTFKKDLMFQFWFNTFFVSGQTPQPSEPEASMVTYDLDTRQNNEISATSWFELQKEDLDKANKDKKNKIYSPNFKLKVYFTVPDVKRDNMDSDGASVDIECEDVICEDALHTHLAVPGTPTETFSSRKKRSKSPDKRNMKHSSSSVSIDSGQGKTDTDDLSDTDDESEWNENSRGTHF